MKEFKNKILIATGGTGGHVFPAYSLAQNLFENKYSVEIVTDNRGYKYLKNYKNLNLKIINSATIFNKNPISIIISFFKIVLAIIKSWRILSNFRPKLVFGMGGYSSFPLCLAAKIMKIPFIIYENNLVIGKANKFLLPYTEKLFVSYLEVEGINEKYKHKIYEVGNIVRQEIINFEKNNSLIGNEVLNILVLGGSQAAKSFGEILPEIFKKCLQNGIKLKIFQQCLLNQKDELEKNYKSINVDFELFTFSYKLLSYFSKINLAITRAGSSMMAELLNCKIPIIAVPFPYAADNHQLKNAKYFEQKGYGFLIQEKEINTKLFPLIKTIHRDKNLLNQMIKNQNIHSDKFVFEKINTLVKKYI